MSMSGEDNFFIRDWSPLWLDHGKRLIEILEEMAQHDLTEDQWVIMCAFICSHMEYDIELHRAGNAFISEIYDEDA